MVGEGGESACTFMPAFVFHTKPSLIAFRAPRAKTFPNCLIVAQINRDFIAAFGYVEVSPIQATEIPMSRAIAYLIASGFLLHVPGGDRSARRGEASADRQEPWRRAPRRRPLAARQARGLALMTDGQATRRCPSMASPSPSRSFTIPSPSSIWRAGKILHKFECKYADTNSSMCFSADNSTLAGPYFRRIVRLADCRRQESSKKSDSLAPRRRLYRGLCVSPDGKLVAAPIERLAGKEAIVEIKVTEVATGKNHRHSQNHS